MVRDILLRTLYIRHDGRGLPTLPPRRAVDNVPHISYDCHHPSTNLLHMDSCTAGPTKAISIQRKYSHTFGTQQHRKQASSTMPPQHGGVHRRSGGNHSWHWRGEVGWIYSDARVLHEFCSKSRTPVIMLDYDQKASAGNDRSRSFSVQPGTVHVYNLRESSHNEEQERCCVNPRAQHPHSAPFRLLKTGPFHTRIGRNLPCLVSQVLSSDYTISYLVI